MSAIVSTHKAHAFHHASDLPDDVWRALSQKEAAANVILPFARKALNLPRERNGDEQLWIALYDGTNNVEFVLSCTKGALGNYPIFIVACKSPTQLAQEVKVGRDLADAMLPLVQCLLSKVLPQRVFSVFALASVAEKFSQVFGQQVPAEHGIRAINDLYYDATLTFCSTETLKKPSESVSSFPQTDDVVISLRRANMSDLDSIKVMCKEFSETSPPYVLNEADAELEARVMIEKQQVWVHVIQKSGQEPEIACLIATTRDSDNVTAVTKVYTPEKWRGRGCAARLLHRICQDVLSKKELVVLYVGNSDELKPARSVYHKVGFQGLKAPQGQQIEGVERWIEIGFEGTILGHW